jgi:6-pyruvoyltetrahydropterin/6-carboxytetrahydropterin synthase
VYELTVERGFSAAHLMRGHPAPARASTDTTTACCWVVEGEKLDDCGMLVDFADLKRVFDGILDELDHRNLNEIPPFDEINPSSENLARHIYEQVRRRWAAGARQPRHRLRIADQLRHVPRGVSAMASVLLLSGGLDSLVAAWAVRETHPPAPRH